MFQSWYNQETDSAEPITELVIRFEKDGNKRYVVEVIADNASFTGERTENPREVTSISPAIKATVSDFEPPVAIQQGVEEITLDDDLPF
jgi:hypothetical protein